jgi:hypothetical protein
MTEPYQRYFGVWSYRDIKTVSDLLNALEVRFEINEYETTQEVLEEWHAWDPTSQQPNIGFDLWINWDDLPKVGDKIVIMFPERKFGAN